VAVLRNKKAKGTSGERDLVHKFWALNWACIRVAGSGSSRYPSPDILAGNGLRKVAVECKTTSKEKIYIEKKQIEGLQYFSGIFGTESYIAVKFPEEEWLFLSIDDLNESEKSYVIGRNHAISKGFILDELIGNFL